jgi:TolB protein
MPQPFLTRRSVLTLGVGAAALGAMPRFAQAQPVVKPVIRTPQRILIAIPEVLPRTPADAEAARILTRIVVDNLRNSKEFAVTEPFSADATITDFDAVPRFAAWKGIDYLVTGRVHQAGGRAEGEFRLWDVASGHDLHGRQYATTAENMRRIGHAVADDVHEQLTGRKGNFDPW